MLWSPLVAGYTATIRTATAVAERGRDLYRTKARVTRRAQLKARTRRGEPLTLFLAPDAGLKSFHATHSILAHALQDAGQAVAFLSCEGVLATCSHKMAARMQPTASGDAGNPACVACRKAALETNFNYRQHDIPLESLLEDADREVLASLQAVGPLAMSHCVFDEIEFGSAALGETLRDRRKTHFDALTASDHELLAGIVHASLMLYLGLKRLLSSKKVERIIYFGDYAYIFSPLLIAKKHDIPLNLLSHGYNRDIDRRLASIRPSMAGAHIMAMAEAWPKFKNIPVTPEQIELMLDGALFRLSSHGGISTFSPNFDPNRRDVLAELGLSPEKKTIVAYTSSDDEVVCRSHFFKTLGMSDLDIPLPFPSQEAWLRAIIDWAGSFSDRQLIIRLHPRIAANHRFGSESEQVQELRTMLETVPSNVVVVWPGTPLSSYNIAEMADVALVAWSSIGLELARLGIPSAGAFPQSGGFPVQGVLMFRSVAADYFAAIEELLRKHADNIERIRNGFRWNYYTQWSHLIDIGDVVPSSNYEQVPPYVPPRNADLIVDVLKHGKDLQQFNMARQPSGPTAVAAETAALERAICGMVMCFMTGRDPGSSVALRIEQHNANRTVRTTGASSVAVLTLLDGVAVSLDWQDRTSRRNSPLVHRLGRMLLSRT